MSQERAQATGEVMVGIQPLDVSPAKTTQRPAAALDDVIGLHEGLTVVVKSAVEKLRAPGMQPKQLLDTLIMRPSNHCLHHHFELSRVVTGQLVGVICVGSRSLLEE